MNECIRIEIILHRNNALQSLQKYHTALQRQYRNIQRLVTFLPKITELKRCSVSLIPFLAVAVRSGAS